MKRTRSSKRSKPSRPQKKALPTEPVPEADPPPRPPNPTLPNDPVPSTPTEESKPAPQSVQIIAPPSVSLATSAADTFRVETSTSSALEIGVPPPTLRENKAAESPRAPTTSHVLRVLKTLEDALQSSAVLIPDQSPAPVVVEVREGKIALKSNRDSPLLTSEADFNAWREPIIDHIQELLAADFRLGTNHSRARDRLLALGNLLPGNISEVKERQFRIGYEIERLDGLVAVYRSSADDMPALDAAVLEDLNRLLRALKAGVEKLERWAEFRRMASDDPSREGDANPNTVGDALDEMAAEIERQPKYFDPEVPAMFRFLTEALRDPMGATRTVVCGAFRSAENLMGFLFRRALDIGTKALDAVEDHISKAVATFLIMSLGAAGTAVVRSIADWVGLAEAAARRPCEMKRAAPPPRKFSDCRPREKGCRRDRGRARFPGQRRQQWLLGSASNSVHSPITAMRRERLQPSVCGQ
jgi:hypothetical protein